MAANPATPPELGADLRFHRTRRPPVGVASPTRHISRIVAATALALAGAAAIPAFAGSVPAATAPPVMSALRNQPADKIAREDSAGWMAANTWNTPNAVDGLTDASDLNELPSAVRGDTNTGTSGELRVRLLSPGSAPPGVYAVPGGVAGRSFAFLSPLPFAAKRGAWVGSYHVGLWPAELHTVRSGAYDNPVGFISVTSENADLPVSGHFRLGDFATHDGTPFPKYMVLREALLDKLELVLADLSLRGVPTQHVVVLSGFRTPAYNAALGDASGRARESRHQYGDASDIIIDADHDGRMDDLNGDGRVDAADVRVIEAAVDRVEQAHPELAGGLGLYEATGPSGPFAHIDVRGTRARWGTLGRGARSMYSSSGFPTLQTPSAATGHCFAEGPSAVLCHGFRHSH